MENKKNDATTEQKIKEAARTIFHKKGFAATRTRDIAEEANINLALLNYYFRSKKKLFEIIMMETVSNFMYTMVSALNDENSNLEQKVEFIVSNYIDFVSREPDIPIFLLNEMRNNVDNLMEKLPFKPIILDSVFYKQFQEAVKKGVIIETNPMIFMSNLMSLIIFPFIAKPILQQIGEVDEAQYKKMMQDRKKMIPIWIKSMFYRQ